MEACLSNRRWRRRGEGWSMDLSAPNRISTWQRQAPTFYPSVLFFFLFGLRSTEVTKRLGKKQDPRNSHELANGRVAPALYNDFRILSSVLLQLFISSLYSIFQERSIRHTTSPSHKSCLTDAVQLFLSAKYADGKIFNTFLPMHSRATSFG